MLGICGPTGAGKSTILAALLQRHFDVTSGEIRFHDLPLPRLQLDGRASWRWSIRHFILRLRHANIALGKPDPTPAQIEPHWHGAGKRA